MLLVRWLQNVLFGPVTGPRAVSPSPPAETIRQDGKLLDVVREALREEAEDLAEMVAKGVPAVRRRRLRRRVRRKVRQAIDPAFDTPEVVEEVTEKLVNAAEVDSYYTRLFADDDTR